MTDFTTIARPYARAIFEYASDAKQVDVWSERLQLLAAIVEDSTMQALLSKPVLSWPERADYLLRAYSDTADKATQNFIKLLAENGRLFALPAIVEQYEVYRAELEGVVEATVISAQAVTDAQLSSIAKSLQQRFGKQVNIKNELDEALLGGALIKVGDLVIDGSIKAKLDKLSLALAS